jgi:hypothetical protein
MLQNLNEHIKNCLLRAEESRRRAESTSDPGLKADFLTLEKNWLGLAKSYELSERIECFLLNYHNKRTPEWEPVSTAPFGRDLELAVFDAGGPHALVFPTRRVLGGSIDAETKERIDLHPTHWREWRNVANSVAIG